MVNRNADMASIEALHRRDMKAMKAFDFDTLKSLMDEACILIPPDSDPVCGRDYLDREQAAAKKNGRPDILELEQEWQQPRFLGDYAYERASVTWTTSSPEGESNRGCQVLERILRRQDDGTWRVFRATWRDVSPTG